MMTIPMKKYPAYSPDMISKVNQISIAEYMSKRRGIDLQTVIQVFSRTPIEFPFQCSIEKKVIARNSSKLHVKSQALCHNMSIDEPKQLCAYFSVCWLELKNMLQIAGTNTAIWQYVGLKNC